MFVNLAGTFCSVWYMKTFTYKFMQIKEAQCVWICILYNQESLKPCDIWYVSHILLVASHLGKKGCMFSKQKATWPSYERICGTFAKHKGNKYCQHADNLNSDPDDTFRFFPSTLTIHSRNCLVGLNME